MINDTVVYVLVILFMASLLSVVFAMAMLICIMIRDEWRQRR